MNSKFVKWAIVAFLVINVAGWVYFARSRSTSAVGEPKEVSGQEVAENAQAPVKPVPPTPLALTLCRQVNIDSDGCAILEVGFNDVPETNSVLPRLSFVEKGTSLSYTPLSVKGNAMTVRIDQPAKTSLLNVTLQKGATGMKNPPSQEKIILGCPLSPVFTLRGLGSSQTSRGAVEMSIEFNKFVTIHDAAEFITFDPPVQASFSLDYGSSHWNDGEWGYNALRVTGDFKATTEYKVIVAEGFKAKDGSVLPSTQSKIVTTPDLSPSVNVASLGRYLAPTGNLLVPVETVNVTNISISAERLLSENIVQFVVRERHDLSRWWSGEDEQNSELLTVPVDHEDFPVKSVKNEKMTRPYSLRKSIGDSERGIYLITVWARGDNGKELGTAASKIVCISDIGISALENGSGHEEKIALWITSLSTGKALGGIDVALYSNANELLDKGTSDANGLLSLTVPKDKNFAVVTARDAKTGDMTFLAIENPVDISRKSDRSYLAEGEYEAYVFPDREIFRPGETAFFQILVRDHNALAPKPFPLELLVYRPDNSLFKTFSILPDEHGAARQDVEFPEYLPMGRYGVIVKLPGEDAPVIGNRDITVESFVPPQVRASVGTDVKSVSRGGTVCATASAEHLYGAPAEGLRAEFNVLMKTAAFEPEGWKEYAFGNDGIELNAYKLAAKAVVLDAEGKGSIDFCIPADLKAPARANALISCKVIENGGRPVGAFANVLVDTAPYYLGIPREFPKSVKLNEEVRLPWIAVKADGTAAVRATNVTAKLVKIDTHWSFTTSERGEASWHSEKTETVVMKDAKVAPAGENGKGEFSFRVANYGDYRLVLSDNDTGASVSYNFWASWWANGVSPSALDSFSKLEVTTDKAEYRSGDRAVITVKAPFTGSLRIALMKDKVLKSYVVPMTNKTVDIVLPVSDKSAPNVQVLATLVRETKPEAIWTPHRAIGQTSVKVLPPERVLGVAVEVPKVISPSKVANVTVRVSGKDVGAARVTLLAVDEGICGLTAMETPDPISYFFAERAEYIWYYDVYSRLMKVTDENLTGFVSHVGGGFDDGSLRTRLTPISARRFKPVSLKTYNVELKDGVAVIPVAVPEFTGRLRFMAIAWTASAYGSATAFANVRRDVVVQPDLPRMLAPGDKSYLSVALDNTLTNAVEIAFDIRCEGPLSVSDVPGKVILPARTRKSLSVPVSATDGVGVGKVRMVVSGIGADYVEEIEIPVRPAAAWRAHAQSTTIPAGGTAVFEPEDDVIQSTASQKFELLPCPAADIRSAFAYLRGYPYGCLEQTVSGAFPYLVVAKLPEGYFDEAELADATAAVNAALSRVFTMRRWGGFSMWPDSDDVARFETLYALQFIAEAKRCGYARDFIGNFEDDIRTALRLSSHNVSSYRDKCYVAMDMALFGRPDKPLMARLLDNVATGSCEARAMLARAYLLCGEPAIAAEILEDLPVEKQFRQAAFLLVSLSALNPADPRCVECLRVINESMDKRNGHWNTTQDNALAINAMAAYIAVAGDAKAGKTVSATLKVKVGQKEDAIVFPVGKSAKWSSVEGQGMATCEIANTGDGLLYVRREVNAVPNSAALPPVTNGLSVSREYFTRNGVAIDPARLQRGDTVVVKVTVTSPDERDDLVVEDLLPACLEVEKENMLSKDKLPWFAPNADGDWVIHHEARDDRLVLFGKINANQPGVWYYQARVVSAGEYVVPAIQASAMYAPDIMSRGKASTMKVAF